MEHLPVNLRDSGMPFQASLSAGRDEGMCPLPREGGPDGPVNVPHVRHLSPFRYPGGKTWLVPEVRRWLLEASVPLTIFIEPFAGGASCGLAAAAEGLCSHYYFGDIDEGVSAVWQVIFHSPEEDVIWLTQRITEFTISREAVLDALSVDSTCLKELAFKTLLKNRTHRGGIMAPGAGLVKDGEKGRGLLSRWYPSTLVGRIWHLYRLRECVTFQQKNAFDLIDAFADRGDARWFVDPPYTAGGVRAGARLYQHNHVDHEDLFRRLSRVRGRVMMTYDDAPEVRALAMHYDFKIYSVSMKTNHHRVKNELLLMRNAEEK